jgi:cysteine synthase
LFTFKFDAFLAGVGTGGTLSGVGKVLKEKYPNVEIVAIEPEASPVYLKYPVRTLHLNLAIYVVLAHHHLILVMLQAL